MPTPNANDSSPYSTGGGGVRLEHSYAACLIADLLAGNATVELGDSISVTSIRLQASDISDVDDILLEGRDAQGATHRASIAARRSPSLTTSDSASVPLFRDFLRVVIDHWEAFEAGHWKLGLAVSSTANAITQIAELAALARSLPSGNEIESRLSQAGRTNSSVRQRYNHIKNLVEQASAELPQHSGLDASELTWRILSNLTVRTLRLERTDQFDRTVAVNTLQRILHQGTPATADALFSRIEELVGAWAPQAAVLTQSVIRQALGNYRLAGSTQVSGAWTTLDRLGSRLRDSIRPSFRTGSNSLELERSAERLRIREAMTLAAKSAGSLVVTGDPDVGKSALSLRVSEELRSSGAVIISLSLRDLPQSTGELENSLGGCSIDDVLTAGETGPLRMVLIDGAEAVLEGKASVLQDLAAAAMRAGMGLAAVTRTDGSRKVREVLARACELADSDASPSELILGPLTHDEGEQVASTFPNLARLGSDTRSRWLLGRPGLIDALLRTGTVLDPSDVLCEADVFAAVWRNLIRRDEDRSPGTASPDDRERATLAVVKKVLGLANDNVLGMASAELRADGVLRLPHNPAWSSGDEFMTDLFRDYALCRLLLVEDWRVLISAGAPRWSIRATRLACQVALLTSEIAHAWNSLSAQFSTIAKDHGNRWLEIPYEALLTIGNAELAIREIWGSLTDGDGHALATLLRLADSRYVNATVGDVFALAPIVRVAFADRPALPRGQQLGNRMIREVINDLVLAWLRGMAPQMQPDALRQDVRDAILADDPPHYDDFTVEALSMLGPDLNDRAEAWLRDTAKDRPGSINAAVESFAVCDSMSRCNTQLLLDLAEAYYIELPDPRDRWGGEESYDDGIRDFRHGLGLGFGTPAAAWYYGPFYRLLNTRPVETIEFINRMLNHAARFRARKVSTYRYGDASEDLEGVLLDLPDAGERLFVGDSHVWAWYRGTSVGPYPCMSALLALERFMDHLLERLEIPAREIINFLFRECHNLAVPGLVVGFLTRHPLETGDLLDPFLISTAIWHLETSRVTGEYSFAVRDADADKLTGADRRRYSFQETVAGMVINAKLHGNEERLAQLDELGKRLADSVRSSGSDTEDDAEYLAMVEGWAAGFRIENYSVTSKDKDVLIQFERPEPIERILAPRNAEIEMTNALYRLQNAYGRFNDEPSSWPVETLIEDLATARQIGESTKTSESMPWPKNALVSVAAAAVRSHSLGIVPIDESDLNWAIEIVLCAAETPRVDELSYEGTTFPMGSDRAAAGALPLVFLAPWDILGRLDRARVEQALQRLANSRYDEVRAVYTKGCEPLWQSLCALDDVTGICGRHIPVWYAAMSSLVSCRLGDWSQETQRRMTEPLLPPFDVTLSTVSEDKLLVNRFHMPLSVMVDARRVPCLREEIDLLWTPLWNAYQRSATHWWAKGYDHRAQTAHEPIARRLVEITLDGDRDIVTTFIRSLAENANGLRLLFDAFATVFTYDEDVRVSMAEFWRQSLETALDAIGDGSILRSERHWFDYAIASLLPTPSPHSWDPDIEGTISRARTNWIQPEAIEPVTARWIQLARHEPKAVDAVIKFGKSAPRSWQVSTCLDWIETIIDGRYDLIANRIYYSEEWFADLRSANLIVGDVRTKYHRIVDGLAGAGDHAAVRLQQLDE